MTKYTKHQRELLLEWVAEGLQSDEINRRAGDLPGGEAFHVSRATVDYYRGARKDQLLAKLQADQDSALTRGLALKEVRVARLQQLAQAHEEDLFGGLLWTDDVKSIGLQRVDVEKYNAAEVAQYRGILEDIAKEVGDRKVINEHTGANGQPLFPLDEMIDRGLRKAYGPRSKDDKRDGASQ